MSNVLIGIIGVILFIGLALAGALILGDDFKTANSESKASAVMSTISQMAAAANMYSLKTGSPYSQDIIPPLVPRFIKSVPNPVGGSYVFGFRTASGSLSGGPMAFSLVGWSPASLDGRAICASIAQTYGATIGTNGEPPLAPAPTASPSGCIKLNAQWSDVPSGTYIAWTRI